MFASHLHFFTHASFLAAKLNASILWLCYLQRYFSFVMNLTEKNRCHYPSTFLWVFYLQSLCLWTPRRLSLGLWYGRRRHRLLGPKRRRCRPCCCCCCCHLPGSAAHAHTTATLAQHAGRRAGAQQQRIQKEGRCERVHG